ncbi:MAG: 4-alpha-glucanotransferase [Planctomycetota bacterium]
MGDLAAQRVIFPRAAGVLLPLAALPARHGVGDLGPAAHRFVDWLADAGFTWWQMLPVGPLGAGDSPYASSSAFAGEALYLSVDRLAADGLIRSVPPAPRALRAGPAAYAAARAFEEPLLEEAYRTWLGRGGDTSAEARAFRDRSAAWLEPFLERGGPRALFEQLQFDLQWRALREHARARGVRLMGDAPIFVSLDSVDVASNPSLFRLDADGRPTVLTGCPPDALNAGGQLWGHPHYDWDEHVATDFAWWRARMARQLELFDAVRIDHFIGFHNAWEIPAGASTAKGGEWVLAPGDALLSALADELGGLPLVAEDLGSVTDEVHALRDAHGLAGMRVLQWGFSPGSYHAPHAAPDNSVVYPGTHDNDTAAGWWGALPGHERARFLEQTGSRARGWSAARVAARDLWRSACATHAHTAIVQAQDLLGLGSAARTNVPGTAEGNWTWRVRARDLSAGLARRQRALLEATDRVPAR